MLAEKTHSRKFPVLVDRLPALTMGELQWNQIQKVKYALAVIPGLFFVGALQFLSWFTREGVVRSKESLPPNAICYAFHPEVYLFRCTPTFWRKMMPKMIGLGNHTYVSYAAGLTCISWGMKFFRFRKSKSQRPLEQIVEMLNQYPNTMFGLRTDSGGPYFKVRDSLLDLALKSKRPLVALRQRTTKAVKIHSHSFPLPGAVVDCFTSRIINHEDLASLPRAEAIALIQSTIDDCMLN